MEPKLLRDLNREPCSAIARTTGLPERPNVDAPPGTTSWCGSSISIEWDAASPPVGGPEEAGSGRREAALLHVRWVKVASPQPVGTGRVHVTPDRA
jgi:hypothetical protein